MLEQKGLTRRDLEPAIGSHGRVSEVMTRKTDILARAYATRSAA